MAFMKVKQRRVRYGGGFRSVGRRDLSLRAVSVPVVLPAHWGVGSQKNQESMGRGVGSKKRNHVSILCVSVWLVSVVAR
jgi:hypothetical protein